MRSFQFDPFGEPLATGSLRTLARDKSRLGGSSLAIRIGVTAFWSLVVAIVLARVAFFNPDFAKSFCTVAAACFH